MISTILNDKVTWKILFEFSYAKGKGYRATELKKSIGINNASLYKVLDKLDFYKIIFKENSFYKIDFTIPLSEKLFDIIEQDKKKFNYIDKNAIFILIDFLEKIDSFTAIKQIYVFGSYAKRTNSIYSDIDIAIISKEKIDLFEIIYPLENKYDKTIEIHNFLEKEFSKNNSKLIEEIKRDGIALL